MTENKVVFECRYSMPNGRSQFDEDDLDKIVRNTETGQVFEVKLHNTDNHHKCSFKVEARETSDNLRKFHNQTPNLCCIGTGSKFMKALDGKAAGLNLTEQRVLTKSVDLFNHLIDSLQREYRKAQKTETPDDAMLNDFASIKIGKWSTSPLQQLVSAYRTFKDYVEMVQSDGSIDTVKLHSGIKPPKKDLHDYLKENLPTIKSITEDTMSDLQSMMEELQS